MNIVRKIIVQTLVKKLKNSTQARHKLQEIKKHFSTRGYNLDYVALKSDSGLDSMEFNLLLEKLGLKVVYQKETCRLMITPDSVYEVLNPDSIPLACFYSKKKAERFVKDVGTERWLENWTVKMTKRDSQHKVNYVEPWLLEGCDRYKNFTRRYGR